MGLYKTFLVFCLWDSHATSQHYCNRHWPQREHFIPGTQNVKYMYQSLAESEKVYASIAYQTWACQTVFESTKGRRHNLNGTNNWKLFREVVEIFLGNNKRGYYEQLTEMLTKCFYALD